MFFTSGLSQEIKLPENITEEFIFYKSYDNKINLLKNNIRYVLNKGAWEKQELNYRSSARDSSIIFFNKGFNNIQFKHIEIDSKPYFVLNGGGPVLKIEENKILRIDNSVEQKNQFGAAVFQHDNEPHMYGGYGFWNFKGYITYLDQSSNQWELCKFDSPLEPNPRWKPLFHKKNEYLYVLGGRSSIKESRNTDSVLKDFFRINLNTKKVDLITSEINNQIPLISSSFQGFEVREKKGYIDYSNSSLIVLDFENNLVNSYKTEGLFENKHLDSPVLSLKDSIVFIKQTKGYKKLKFVSINDILKTSPKSFPINIDNKTSLGFKKYGIILLFIFLVFFLHRLFSYKDYIGKFVAHDYQWLYYQKNKVRISEKQSEVIKLIEFKGGFTSHELNQILAPNKSYAKSHLTLLRNTFVTELNKEFKKLTNNFEPLIQSKKNPNDKRQIMYVSNQNFSKKESFFRFLFSFSSRLRQHNLHDKPRG